MREQALKGTCADYLTRPELGLRARQQMGFQIPIREKEWDVRQGVKRWKDEGVLKRPGGG